MSQIISLGSAVFISSSGEETTVQSSIKESQFSIMRRDKDIIELERGLHLSVLPENYKTRIVKTKEGEFERLLKRIIEGHKKAWGSLAKK